MTQDERRILLHWYAGQALASLSMDGTIYHVARTAADLAEAMLEEVERRADDCPSKTR
jgi:signal transduction histidine kinase